MEKKENKKQSEPKKFSLYNWYYRLEHRKNFQYDSAKQAYVFRPKMWIPNTITALVFLALMIYCIISTQFGSNTSQANPDRLSEIFTGIFVPDYSYIFGYGSFTFKNSAIYEALQTFSIALIGTTFGSIFSLPFGFLASSKMVGKWCHISEVLLICIRTIPEIILGYVMIAGLGFSSFSGIMVFSFHSIGMIGKLYSEQLDELETQPLEALDACGGNFTAKLKVGIIPNVAPNFLSVILYRFDLNLRTAAMLGMVCGDEAGLGYWISSFSQNGHWPQFGGALWLCIIMIILVDYFSSYLRKKLV